MTTTNIFYKKIKSIDDYFHSYLLNYRGDLPKLGHLLLNELRTFLDYIILYEYKELNPLESITDCEDDIKAILKKSDDLKTLENNEIFNLKDNLIPIANHAIGGEELSEYRIIYFNLDLLYKLREYLLDNYSISILSFLEELPPYYEKDAMKYFEAVDEILQSKSIKEDTIYLYPLKCQPIKINSHFIYQCSFEPLNDHQNKSNHIIMFSKERISTSYAIKISREIKHGLINNRVFEINYIKDYSIYMSKKDIIPLFHCVNYKDEFKNRTNDCDNLMEIMKKYSLNLLDICILNEREFNKVIDLINIHSRVFRFSELLKLFRKNIKNSKNKNSYKMMLLLGNKNYINDFLSIDNTTGEYKFHNKMYPFEKHPICSYVRGHLISGFDYIKYFYSEDRNDEYIIECLERNSNKMNRLFFDSKLISNINNFKEIVNSYNNKVKQHSSNRQIDEFQGYYYKRDKMYTLMNIEKCLSNFANVTDENALKCIEKFIENNKEARLIQDKKRFLKKVFVNNLTLVYGVAGSGKTTILEFVARAFNDKNKLCVSLTHSCLNMLRNKFKGIENIDFTTIKSYKNKCFFKRFDIIIVDEASMIDNKTFENFLNNIDCDKLIIAGDIHQIESIEFGNWFKIMKKCLNEECLINLDTQFRTENGNLKQLWKCFQNDESKKFNQIQAICERAGFIRPFNELLDADLNSESQIILNLSYDGLYGINNLNNLYQIDNNHELYTWKIYKFKVNDPIIFNTNELDTNIVNGSKGKILQITDFEDSLELVVEYEDLVSSLEKNTIVKKEKIFYLSKSHHDADDDNYDDKLELSIAYASSIHKAQGLQFDDVSVVITDEDVNLITPNIFYTAITRAKKTLKIYIFNETLKKMINNFINYEFDDEAEIYKSAKDSFNENAK